MKLLTTVLTVKNPRMTQKDFSTICKISSRFVLVKIELRSLVALCIEVMRMKKKSERSCEGMIQIQQLHTVISSTT